VKGRGSGALAGLIDSSAMAEQSLHGRRASEANGVVQGSDAVLVRLLNVGAGLEKHFDVGALLIGIGIPLAANAGQVAWFHACLHRPFDDEFAQSP
jgi:hypothetical protein